jgi:hypothetical protein
MPLPIYKSSLTVGCVSSCRALGGILSEKKFLFLGGNPMIPYKMIYIVVVLPSRFPPTNRFRPFLNVYFQSFLNNSYPCNSMLLTIGSLIYESFIVSPYLRQAKRSCVFTCGTLFNSFNSFCILEPQLASPLKKKGVKVRQS